MVIVNNGLLKIVELLKNNIKYEEAGTDDTLPSQSDTDLHSPDTSTKFNVNVINNDNLLTIEYVIPLSTTSNTLQEWGIFFNDDTLLSRSVSASITLENNEELHRITHILIE